MKIEKVAIIGTGTMGTQIAILASLSGYEVSAYDEDAEAFARARQNLATLIAGARGKGVPTLDDWQRGGERVRPCPTMAQAVADADLVIEAVPEQLDRKRRVFAQIEQLAPSDAIFATNSSSIPIARIAAATTRLQRCLNLHFFFPALGTKMVEVMGAKETMPEVLEACTDWVHSLGCLPISIKKESYGLCFNRIWRAVKREALRLWAEGYVDFRDIDRAWMTFTGMRQGPFGMMDRVGLDVVYDIEMSYHEESRDPHDLPPEQLAAMIKKGELGIKSGKGFYTYPDPEYLRGDFLSR